MISVQDDRPKRTIRITMSGLLDLEEVTKAAEKVKRATDAYARAPHLCLADMRGMKPSSPQVAALLGEAIGYTRQRGVAHCAHLSDSSIVSLQTARLAREVAPGDPAITNVVSLEEAEKVLDEQRRKLPPLK